MREIRRFILQMRINGVLENLNFDSREAREKHLTQMIYDGRQIRVLHSGCWEEKTVTYESDSEFETIRNFLTMDCLETL